jgi:conjugative relaxase-like TrwC/TraI family protein
VALPVKALKAGQESYWLDQIARNREEYFSGRGESPGRFVGSAAQASGLEGTASPEQVRAMFQGLDPATGEQQCAPLWRADPRSKLAAGPLLEALKFKATERGVQDPEALAGSKALKGDMRSVQAACQLGGAKRVKVETVERLSRKVLGVDPRSLYGEGFDQAWGHRGKRVNQRVQAFDHCFSSPKSVSLLAAAGGPQTRRLLAEGRAEALQVSIQYLERHGIGVRRDHNGTDRYPAVGGLVAVAFEHRMSRAGDPNTHTHVLVQNAAQGPDGRWTALDSDRLYAHLMAADHLYLAAERAALTQRLGVRWGPVDGRSGAAEIQGLDDRTLIERFSKRSEQIDQWLDSHGLSGIKASSAAAVATRAPKDYSESEQSVYQRWTHELAEQGVGERQLAEVCSGGRGRPASRTELDAALDALSSPDGLTGQASTFTRTDVVDALAKRLPVGRSAQEALDQVEAVADRFLDERAMRVGRDRRLGMDRFSTPELLGLEQQLVDGATGRAGESCAVVRPEVVRQVLDRHGSAGEDQAAMVRDLTQGGAGVAVVVGRAGSGKTWALGLAREAFELDGYQVLGCAPTGIATVGLADEGFADARTIDRLLLDLGRGRTELDGRTVLVVDEAAMVGTRKLAPLLHHAERAGAKVVLVGDDRQFASIQAGGGFRALRLRLGASELTVNRRQVEAWEQRAIDDVRAGNLEQAIAAYAEHDRIRAFEGRDDRDRALVADWWQAHQAGEQPVIYAHRRAQVDQLNAVCQRLRAEAGQLGPERLAVGDRSFAVGDVVVLGANARGRLGVVNGTTAIITDLELQGRAMTVRTLEEEPPKMVRLPGWYLDAQVQPGQSRRVDLAYARTDMRSQGRTEQRALLALDGAEDMQGGYVQLTRGKHRTDLYLTVGPEPLGPDEERPHPARKPRPPEELLARVLSRDGSKTLATDTPTCRMCGDCPPERCGPSATGWPSSARPVLRTASGSCSWPPDGRPRPNRPANRPAPTTRPPASRSRPWPGAGGAGGTWPRQGSGWYWPTMPCGPQLGRPTRRPNGSTSYAASSSGIWAGWKLTTPSSAPRSGRWRGRMPGGAGSTNAPWPWTRRAGCWRNSAPSRPTRRSGRCGGWPPRNWMAIGAPTASTTQGRRSIAGAGWLGTGGRRQRPPGSPPRRPMGPAGSRSSSAAASTLIAEATAGSGRRYPVASGTKSTGCWAPNPAGRRPAAAATGRPPRPPLSAWPAGAATATTTTSPIPTGPTATGPGVASTAPVAARNATSASPAGRRESQ